MQDPTDAVGTDVVIHGMNRQDDEGRATRLRRITGELQVAASMVQQLAAERVVRLDSDMRLGKQGEDADAAAHVRLQALFDGAMNAILLADDGGRYVDANPAACVLLGYARDELLRLSVHDLLGEVQPAAVAWQRFLGAQQQAGRARLRRKDGSFVVADYMATANIQPGLHLSVLEDASSRMQTEQSLVDAKQQLRDLAAQHQERLDETRAELARDLHDELGQLLGGLRLEADLIARVDAGAAQRMHLLLSECTAAVRDLARAQRPAALDLGLVPTLQGLAEDFSRRGERDIAVQLEPVPASLPVALVLMLFRVAQEALGNAVRHAQACRISLSLTHVKQGLLLCVQDDGCGFDVEAALQGQGMGLVGMRERASRAGARLDVHSEPAAGSCISLLVPQAVLGHPA